MWSNVVDPSFCLVVKPDLPLQPSSYVNAFIYRVVTDAKQWPKNSLRPEIEPELYAVVRVESKHLKLRDYGFEIYITALFTDCLTTNEEVVGLIPVTSTVLNVD